MWIVIIIVIFFVAQFFVSKQVQSSKITKQGGMRNKYSQLIDIILTWNPNARIAENGSDYISISASSESGIIDFLLVQNSYNLSVQWIVENSAFGKHKLKWEFNEFNDQKKMAQKINHDVAQYSKNITGNSDPISNHLGDFQNEFTIEQKAVMISNLLMIAEVDGETQSAALQQIEYTAKLLGIDLDDQIFLIIQARMFVEGVDESGPKYFSRILNSLSKSQKEWFTSIAVGIMTASEINTIFTASSYNVIKSFGIIRISDPQFIGRKAGDLGNEYILVRDANGDQFAVGLIKGTPTGANAFEIKQLEQIADFGEVKAGQVYFKAFAVVEEEE